MMTQPLRLSYTLHGDKEKPALILLHGFMGSSSDWDDIIPFLTATSYCIAVDLPGHGKSFSGRAEDFSMEACAASVVSLMNELNLSRASLLGYSMGGRLAMYLAIKHGGRFDAVMIESASPGLKTAEERQERRELDDQLAHKILTMPLGEFVDEWYRQALFATIDRESDKFAEMLQRRHKSDRKGLSMSLRHMGTGSQPSLWNELGQAGLPMLLIVGRHDVKFRLIASEIAEKCSVARMVTIDRAGHNVHFENPEAYVRQVTFFLENTRKD